MNYPDMDLGFICQFYLCSRYIFQHDNPIWILPRIKLIVKWNCYFQNIPYKILSVEANASMCWTFRPRQQLHFCLPIVVFYSNFNKICSQESNKQNTSIAWQNAWWRHQMETFSALLVICAGVCNYTRSGSDSTAKWYIPHKTVDIIIYPSQTSSLISLTPGNKKRPSEVGSSVAFHGLC